MQIYILTNRIKEAKYQQRFASSSEYRNGSFTLDISYIFTCSAAAHFCMFCGCTFLRTRVSYKCINIKEGERRTE